MNVPLKVKLLEQGISQFQLSRDLGISDSYLSKVVNGWVEPPVELKARIASLLGCPVSEIFAEKAEDKI